MIEQIDIRIIIGLLFMVSGLVCYILSHRPALSKKEERELKKLDKTIAEMFGGK